MKLPLTHSLPKSLAAALACLCALAAALPAAPNPPAAFLWNESAKPMPAWVQNQVIYEVNVRQYSQEGSFAALEADLDRIHALGAHLIWLMPIHPIGELNRKGPLGSYYAVKDFYAVNPEFGSADDFRSLVNAIHARGMRVILDWVANHSAWDNPLTQSNPALYERDAAGNFIPPHGTDWSDVIQFDVQNPELAAFHADAMGYWVREFNVDGFRCDFAVGLPIPFWQQVSAALRALKPDIFMLAESDHGTMQRDAFDATYAWQLMHEFDRIAQGKAPANAIDAILAARSIALPAGSREMLFTSNHDENSWLGTVFERLGGGIKPFAALTFTLDGIPLIYNGQESGLAKRLKFFERDPIAWQPSPLFAFYQTLTALKANHPALRTGTPIQRIPSSADHAVFAFRRTAPDGQAILFIANLTARDIDVTIGGPGVEGTYTNVFSQERVTFNHAPSIALKSWDFLILSQ